MRQGRQGNRRQFLRHAGALLGGVVLEGFAQATPGAKSRRTFYIDTAGDNANSGLSAGKPWKDFSRVNALTLGPGDRVLLRRGCVWRDELMVRGTGAPGRFLEIGNYGEGARPKIQRNGWPTERCVQLRNASFLKLWGMEVCDAGAGIVLFYDHSYNNQSVYLHDVVAHDFRGVPFFREGKPAVPQPPARPDRVSWAYGIGVTGVEDPAHNQARVLTDFSVTGTEVYNTGAGIALDWGNHFAADGTLVLANKFGDVFMDGLHLHDNTVEGISFVSLFLTSVTGCVVQNSLIERGTRYAGTGTAAVQVMYARDVILRNLTVKDTPFNKCPDNGGIDFECNNENVLVDGCTFINNAGPAIEVLATPGNADPYTRNLTVRNCTFDKNNWAHKIGSSQIDVPNWDKGNTPTGLIEGNRYRNAPDTTFFGGDGNLSRIKVQNNQALKS